MQQWMSSQKRLICEEQEEEDEASNQHQKSSQLNEDEDGQLHALPSESSNSISIDPTDIAIDSLNNTKFQLQLSGAKHTGIGESSHKSNKET